MNLSRRDLLKSTALSMSAVGMSGCMSVGDGKESINLIKKHDISLKFMIEPTYLRFQGSPYEVGRQQGEQMRQMIRYTWRRVRKRFYEWDIRKLNLLTERLVDETNKRFPEEIEEMQGIAEGAGLDFEQIFLINRHIGYDVGCCCLAFQKSTLGAIAGGNLDDDPIYFLRDADITGQYRTIAVTWPGTIGCGQGINEHGLGMVGTTALPRYTKEAPEPSFLMDKFSSPQRVLRSCKTVAEAIEFMKRPDIAGHGNLLFVDAGNNVALVEKYKQTFVSVRYPDEYGFLYAVNNFLSEVTTKTRREKMESRNKDRIIAFEKYGKQIKKNKHITLEIMREILRDTYRNESDWSICNYRAYMSTILIPGRREFLVINGPANLGEYIRYSLR